MTRTGFPFIALIAAACLLPALIASPALAQSQNELRRENQRLRTEVADLEAELEAARAEIAALRAEIVALRALLEDDGQAAPPSTAPTPEPEVTVDESKPQASPRALLAAIIEDYQEETADWETGTGPDDSDRTAYLRRLGRWAAGVNREYRLPVEWHVRILEPAVRVGRDYRLRLRAVDPETDAQLGDPFDAVLSRSVASRLREREERYGLEDQLLLKGVVQPNVMINQERTERGAFDNPRFVGPFVEFEFTVQAQTIVPVPKAPAGGGSEETSPDAG